jgi:hypothetical protein
MRGQLLVRDAVDPARLCRARARFIGRITRRIRRPHRGHDHPLLSRGRLMRVR